MNLFSVSKKIIVVTGAGRGIGKHLANSLYKQGAIVVGVDKEFAGNDYLFETRHIGDLTRQEHIKELKEKLSKTFKKVDVLINNAGITRPSTKIPYPYSDWRKTMSVNLDIPFNLTSSLIPLLRNSKSPSVVNVSSLNAIMSFPNNPAYVASKTALVGLTRSMALDFGCEGMRFNCIAPGYIKTEMTGESWSDPEKRKDRQSRTILNRWGTPED